MEASKPTEPPTKKCPAAEGVFSIPQLVVFRFDGKEALRMAAYRAFFRCFYGFYGVAAVSAHPKFLFAFLEDLAVFDISQ